MSNIIQYSQNGTVTPTPGITLTSRNWTLITSTNCPLETTRFHKLRSNFYDQRSIWLRAPCRNTDFSLFETLWASCESAAFVLSAAFDVQLGTAGTAGRVFRVALGIAMAIQMSPYLMSLAFQAKSPAKDSAMDALTEKSDNSGKMQMMQPISRGPQAEKMPLPGFVKRELHEQGRCEPCLFKYKGTGCWYGDECRYCHFCTPEQVRRKQSQRFYMERALRKEKKFDQGQGAPSMCFHMICNLGFWISNGNGSLSTNAWRLMIK